MEKYEKVFRELISGTGIEINGNNSYDIQVRDNQFYKNAITTGSLGLGESYMEELWDCERLDEFIHRLLKGDLDKKVRASFQLQFLILKSRLFNQQSKSKAIKSIGSHYDIGNDLYENMLDDLMIYSCGYWKDAENLNQAQENKLELICRKLKLKPGQKVLDIGCGWGGFAFYAASKYGVEVTGITISKEQQELAQQRCKNLPVEIRFQDYRELNEKFDRIVSIGMLEHVGYKNYDGYMKVINQNLEDDGICLLHTIGGNKSLITTDAWINKYIFPGGLIPSIAQIGKACENKLIVQDLHNFGPYYDKTLMSWYSNFTDSREKLKENYSRMFFRMWEFYLCSSAAGFRAKHLNLWQFILTKKEFPHFYESVRPKKFQAHKSHLATEHDN